MRIMLITITILSVVFNSSFAQNPNLPCGTAPGRSAWLKDYQQDPSRFSELLESRNGGIMYLPLTIHIVGRTDSVGAVGYDAVLKSFCELNEDFSATGIQFFIEGSIRYIYETEFYSHDSVKAGGIRMLQYNVANTINVYFVGNPAGNCGYNLPYGGIAMGNGCIFGHTFAHEMGHCLSMPHTFLGWEGGYSWNGNPVQSFNSPAPEMVTINYTDFKDTIYLNDTLIIDTVFVENVARAGATANCSFAADGFCDTPSDYLAFRWLCSNTNSISGQQQLDPDSVSFRSDGWYIMSYAYDECQVGFSQEQIDAMKAFVLTKKPNWLYNQSPMNDSVGLLTKLAPLDAAIISDQNPRFEWNATTGATHYFLEIYKEPYAANQILERVLLTDTFYQTNRVFSPRPAIFPYAWRVYPFNYGNTCAGYSPVTYFNTVLSAAVEQAPELILNWDIYPNYTSAGNSFKIRISDILPQLATLNIYSATGQIIWSEHLSLDSVQELEFAVPANWASGLYFVELGTENGLRSVKKLILK